MKFTVSQSSLTQAIGVVMKGVASASTLPILSGVLVKAQDGILEFQTSNYTISIRHRIAAHVEEEGEMVIPCKMLSNITKTLPDAPVTFELSERQVLIGCEKSSFRLNTLDANDFPEFPAYAIESAVELPTDILSEMVGRVWRVTSTDNVPADAFNDALNIMASQATIMIGATDTQVVFEAGNTTYVSRRIEGVYPNYKQLIPDSCVTSVKIDVAAFNAALKRVASSSRSMSRTGRWACPPFPMTRTLHRRRSMSRPRASRVPSPSTTTTSSAASMPCPRRRRSRWSSRATRRRASSSPTTRSTTCTWSCRSASSAAL